MYTRVLTHTVFLLARKTQVPMLFLFCVAL